MFRVVVPGFLRGLQPCLLMGFDAVYEGSEAVRDQGMCVVKAGGPCQERIYARLSLPYSTQKKKSNSGAPVLSGPST